jgi:hypothetical protein
MTRYTIFFTVPLLYSVAYSVIILSYYRVFFKTRLRGTKQSRLWDIVYLDCFMLRSDVRFSTISDIAPVPLFENAGSNR